MKQKEQFKKYIEDNWERLLKSKESAIEIMEIGFDLGVVSEKLKTKRINQEK